MICHDDNFTDLSRGYGRRQVQVMAVPTNDWRQVMGHHLDNSLFRAVESGFGMVRAASNGISVIASPRGEVLAQQDHFATGPGVIVADLWFGPGGTWYSRFGDWVLVLCGAVLLVGAAGRWRQARER
jgi:apolipoprotein N-acyltransferase